MVEEIIQGLEIPWGLAFIGQDTLLISERGGSLLTLNIANGIITTIEGTPAVLSAGQGGLLDVSVPPDYPSSNWIYFTYVKAVAGQGTTVLARAQLSNHRLSAWQDLVVSHSRSDTRRHFGSRVTFDDQGHLYMTIGDRGVRDNGQDLSTHAGSILRINRDGSIPADNPFINHNDSLPEIWSYGHRNPQGIAYDAKRGRLWAIEHGPRGGDELNLIKKGANYGWPVISHGQEYWGPIAVGEGTHKAGMEQPLKIYTPSIAPGSLLHYSGKAFPSWQGNLFAGALKLRHLNRLQLDINGQVVAEQRLLESLDERIRALVEDHQGWIYLSTDSGRILRMRPTGCCN